MQHRVVQHWLLRIGNLVSLETGTYSCILLAYANNKKLWIV